jgi:hypothetical protein
MGLDEEISQTAGNRGTSVAVSLDFVQAADANDKTISRLLGRLP